MKVFKIKEKVFHEISSDEAEFTNSGYVTDELIQKAIEFNLHELATELTSNKEARDEADAQMIRHKQKFFAFLDYLHAPWCRS